MVVSATPSSAVRATSMPASTAPSSLALELRGVSKSYPGTKALTSVSFTLKRFGMLGLVGENGAGKSTLLSIVNGTVRPDEGTVAINGKPVRFGHPSEAARLGVATVFQEQGLIATIPVYENIFLGREKTFSLGGVLHQPRMIAEAKAVLDELEIDVSPRALTGNLSFGQRQLVEIAKAFAVARIYPVEPVILLDEPTSALSDSEAAKLFDGIRRWRKKGSFVLVSHRLRDVFAICEEVVALKDGCLVLQRGIDEVDEALLHQSIVGRERNAFFYHEGSQREPEAEIAVSAAGLSKSSQVQDVSFDLRAGEILGVAGVLGSGKSMLAKLVAGVEQQDKGMLTLYGTPLKPGARRQAIDLGIGYVPAERTIGGIIGTDTIENNLTLPNMSLIKHAIPWFLSPSLSRNLTKQWIGRLRVRPSNGKALCRTLSGGNQQKVVFGKWLARGVRILVLDDPARGLDVGAKEDLYALMREMAAAGAAILLVSDNLAELIGLSNRILVMRNGQCSALIDAPKDAKPREIDILPAML
ncbi:sugar ABC transporter ATP-binding protein [Acidisoma cellulosilytica]|uniref:Sugar ABC transporter ATP-binding protein n=1 Tax=Acidisoma cellulosilyticum TaxID=2802395 RepID=A0A963Z4V9_9PROT|nr:sugar ABC transporter ATP-binding protein [Acidisoma cellulosilyticum]MCB8882050.1 sugar ABC transporter ATP-binding protein [Acidisoma cellulosilyticum]